MKRLVLTLLLVIAGDNVLSANGCTQEQIAKMIKENLSQETIDSACDKEKQSHVQKERDRLYIGIGITTGSGTLTATGNSTVTLGYDSSSTPFKVGYIFNNDNRFELSYESMNHKFSGGTDMVSGFNLDWNFIYPKNSFSPYWTIGFGSYEYENTGDLFVSGENLEGFSLNYGVGLLYSIDKNLEFEASYKGKAIIWQDIVIGYTTVTSDSSGSALYLGLNLKF